jgi:hypothetical protein
MDNELSPNNWKCITDEYPFWVYFDENTINLKLKFLLKKKYQFYISENEISIHKGINIISRIKTIFNILDDDYVIKYKLTKILDGLISTYYRIEVVKEFKKPDSI